MRTACIRIARTAIPISGIFESTLHSSIMEQTLRLHKSAYLFCAAAYIFFMLVQYFFWLGAKYVSFLVILASLPPFLGQVYCIKMLRFEQPSIYFPASFFCWLAGVFVIFGTDSGAKLISVFTAGPALLGMLLLYSDHGAARLHLYSALSCAAKRGARSAQFIQRTTRFNCRPASQTCGGFAAKLLFLNRDAGRERPNSESQ